MMRRSGVRPAVKCWKLACEMLRRAASGHIEATQLLKFAAASRIADAVINGCPEAPSSPLQGSGALAGVGAGCVCGRLPGSVAGGVAWLLEAELPKMFSRNFRGPPSPDWARAPLHASSVPATIAAVVVRLLTKCPSSPPCPHPRWLS